MVHARKQGQAMIDFNAELERHKGVNLTAGWKGSPDPQDSRNIRRVCSCGAVIDQLPYPQSKPGKPVTFRLGGDPFDTPHRAHIAEALAALM